VDWRPVKLRFKPHHGLYSCQRLASKHPGVEALLESRKNIFKAAWAGQKPRGIQTDWI
jgi:hypothetical protein